MKNLKKLSDLVSKLSVIAIVISIIIAGLNLTVPYYLASRQSLADITNNFGTLANRFQYENIVEDGGLIIKDSTIETAGDYSISFNYSNDNIISKNFINFEQTGVTISINDSDMFLPYKSGENITMEEIIVALFAALQNIPTLNIMGSIMIAFLHVMLIVSIFMIVAYFILKKRYKYRNLIRYSSISVLIGAFIVSILSLTILKNKLIAISIFTVIAGAINMLILLPAYNKIKSEDYM
ncbi:hypothetical protein [Clostridium tertium]|uniref:DUF1189 domain-containing protein n=1 Tax=Clostridium tertium TaxID=1559 RepID=A0A6N3B1F9_9CLOT